MKVKVIKKNGKKEDFVVEKVVMSCLKSGANLETARRIAKIVEGRALEKGEISTKEIANLVLRYLKQANPNWHRSWVIYTRYAKAKKKKVEKELNKSLREYMKK